MGSIYRNLEGDGGAWIRLIQSDVDDRGQLMSSRDTHKCCRADTIQWRIRCREERERASGAIVADDGVVDSTLRLQGFRGVRVLRQVRLAPHHGPISPLLPLHLHQKRYRFWLYSCGILGSSAFLYHWLSDVYLWWRLAFISLLCSASLGKSFQTVGECGYFDQSKP